MHNSSDANVKFKNLTAILIEHYFLRIYACCKSYLLCILRLEALQESSYKKKEFNQNMEQVQLLQYSTLLQVAMPVKGETSM